jgi:FkbM family methyltransferase
MFFDIGANLGRWASANLAAFPGTQIICVEASPLTFERLKQQCVHDKITLLNYAVCDNGGKDITFYHANCDTLSTLNKDWLASEESRFHNQPFTEIICKTITLDSLIEQYGMPSLIKIDVEGGEYECVKSLTKKVDHLCFEWASEVNPITFKCLDYLQGLGFSSFYVQFQDAYTYRPDPDQYYSLDMAKEILGKTTPKNEWGMVWCK